MVSNGQSRMWWADSDHKNDVDGDDNINDKVKKHVNDFKTTYINA